MHSENNLNQFFCYGYPIVTACLAVFVAFSGYCVYKRTQETTTSDEKTYKLFERRLIKILHRAAAKSAAYKLPTPEERRNVFLNKIAKADKFIQKEEHDMGVNYIIEAMTVCSKPAAVLKCLSRIIPKLVYTRLINRLSTFI